MKPTVPDKDPQPKDPAIACPKDGTKMQKVHATGVTADCCAACGSVWLDALELERLLKDREATKKIDTKAAGTPPAPPGKLLCPRDHSQLIDMVDRHQPHVHLRSCKVCGGCLLDAGKLKDLSRFTLRERVASFFH